MNANSMGRLSLWAAPSYRKSVNAPPAGVERLARPGPGRSLPGRREQARQRSDLGCSRPGGAPFDAAIAADDLQPQFGELRSAASLSAGLGVHDSGLEAAIHRVDQQPRTA